MKTKKPRVTKRRWNIYCDEYGNVWWDDGVSFWNSVSKTEANKFFRHQLQIQLDEAKGKYD